MFLVDEEDDDDRTPPGGGGTPSGTENETEDGHGNSGTLIIDASCAPADIAYPTGLELCDRARRWTESILDHYWKECGAADGNGNKPRTYRKTGGCKNRGLCKRHGIRLSGPRLGKPGKNHMEEIRQELKETGERNAVEGKFGNGKRKQF